MAQNPLVLLDSQKFDYGTTPNQAVAEQNQTFFAYFDGVGGTGPEVIDQTAYFIKYLIDTEGNVVNPEPDVISNRPQAIGLYNLTNNFEVGKNAIVKLIEPDPTVDEIPNSEILTGIHPITYVGRIAPILVTETGQNKSDYILTMSFIPPPPPSPPPVDDISTLVRLVTTFSASEQNARLVNFGEEIYGENWSFGGSNITLTPLSTAEAGTRIKLKFSLAMASPGPSYGSNGSAIRLTINKNTPVPGDNIVVQSSYLPIEAAPRTNPRIYTIETDWIDSAEGDVYRAYYDLNVSGTGNTWHIIMGSDEGILDTYLLVQQENAPYDPDTGPVLINGVNVIYSTSIWDDSYFNIYDYPDEKYSLIVWGIFSKQIFDSGLTQTLDPSSSLQNFSEIKIPFSDVKPGDFIRIEYNKNQVYTIFEVNPNNTFVGPFGPLGPFLTFKVTPNIGNISGINLNLKKGHFVIYRVIKDGTYVVLDVKKDAPGGAYSGIIQPEFVSQELVNNYDKIITDLTEREIIQ